MIFYCVSNTMSRNHELSQKDWDSFTSRDLLCASLMALTASHKAIRQGTDGAPQYGQQYFHEISAKRYVFGKQNSRSVSCHNQTPDPSSKTFIPPTQGWKSRKGMRLPQPAM